MAVIAMDIIEYVKMVSEEFRKWPEDEIAKWVEFCKPMVSKKQYGKLYDQALALLICHKMKMAGLGDNPLGEMSKLSNAYSASSISDGGSSISFQSSGVGNLTTDAEYTMTIYGTQYLQLRRMAIVPIHVSGEDGFYGGI